MCVGIGHETRGQAMNGARGGDEEKSGQQNTCDIGHIGVGRQEGWGARDRNEQNKPIRTYSAHFSFTCFCRSPRVTSNIVPFEYFMIPIFESAIMKPITLIC